MQADKTPHYSHIVHDINSRGGLKMHFGQRGQQGEGWIRHLDSVVPENGVLLHELQTVDSVAHHSSAFHEALRSTASGRNTAVFPAGFYGEDNPASGVPSFTPSDFLFLMPKSARHLTDDTLQRYQELQSIREMRAAVGSLAWLAAHMGIYSADYESRPAILWGRTHSTSLPNMYQRLGINSVEIQELDAPLRYTYLKPHGMRWSEADIQNAFHVAYVFAKQALTAPATVLDPS